MKSSRERELLRQAWPILLASVPVSFWMVASLQRKTTGPRSGSIRPPSSSVGSRRSGEIGYSGARNAAPALPGGELRLVKAVAERLGIIVQRLQSERVLHTLSRAVEESPNAVLISDIHGRIEYVNPGFTRVTGYTAEEVLGQNPELLNSGEQPPEFYRELWSDDRLRPGMARRVY